MFDTRCPCWTVARGISLNGFSVAISSRLDRPKPEQTGVAWTCAICDTRFVAVAVEKVAA